jgi:hypothetical protein
MPPRTDALDSGRLASGWYPDPRDATHTQLRWWDGSKWTDEVHAAPQVPYSVTAAPTVPSWGQLTRRGRVRTLVIAGGALLGISPFLTWVNVVLLGGLNLFQLLDAAGKPQTLAWLAIAIGAAVIGIGLKQENLKTVRILGFILGLVAGSYAALILIAWTHDLRQADGLAQISYGPWVALFGCVLMVVAMFVREAGPVASVSGQGTSASHEVQAGWYPDPRREARERYWDGAQWTEHLRGGAPRH